jgi:prepilin-type N-terminal cleavage/methylation domain-containing protein
MTRRAEEAEGETGRMNRGFTLVELLIVILVLGVLSSIASAKIHGMRDEAEAASCRSNLANLATAEELYSTHHGYIHFTGSIGDLEPFCSGASGMVCPSGGDYILDFDSRGGVRCSWGGSVEHGSVAGGIKSWE